MRGKPFGSIFTVALILLVFSLGSDGRTQPFTLEQVMSAPFPGYLTAAPVKDRIAWVFNHEGRRNIFVAEGPAFQPVQVTHYDQDDGQALGQLAFSPDGEIIVYVRGGSANRQGAHPNPTSDPRGAEQAVWAVRIGGGSPWKLGKGSSPAVSPTGDRVALVRRGTIFIARIDSANSARPLFYARGRNGNPVWSPDGSKLAFVSYRDDHSFIGIYDLQARKITWISPSVDRDFEPVWSPDGKKIAFIRYPGRLAEPRRRREAGVPFSFWVADVKTGQAQRIWTSPDSSGGFAQYYPRHPLMWAANDHLVFYSEHDGWMHLYSVSIRTGKVTCLTPGEFEVEDASLSPDRRYVVFNSNQNDIDRRHLWKVAVSGGNPIPLTEGKGLEWSPVVTSSGKFIALLCSTARQPAAPAIMPASGGKFRLIAREWIPKDFPMDKLVEPRPVIFRAGDGLEIHGQLFLPRDAKPGDNRPAVIFMHGGPIRQMLLGWHMRGYYHNAYALNQYLAAKGYVVLSVNYRSGIGYGRAFRLARGQGPKGATEYQDIIAAGRYLQSRPEVDPRRIGLWGGSYGGYLTAMGLARDSDLFAAGVDLHGVHDWSLRARRRGSGDWGIAGDDLMRLAYDSSPVADVAFWTSPVLFIHGDDDRNVDFIQTTDLVQRLRREGKAHVEVLVFPDEVHSFLMHKSWLKAYRAAADFFDRFLMRKK